MYWSVPAKTFLIGEYAALCKQSAILLTTKPCFELKQVPTPGLHGIHPASPAGKWWNQSAISDLGLGWHDPYQGRGGMGASSGQFVAVYQACANYYGISITQHQLLEDYQNIIQNQGGVLPSGYDVLAQYIQSSVVYINHHNNISQAYDAWPFHDIGYILIHTGQKLPTHTHLQTLDLKQIATHLTPIVEQAKSAFDTRSSSDLISAVNAYHTQLNHYGWVAPHTLTLIEHLKREIKVLAIKGCGAMGSDVILLLVSQADLQNHLQLLATQWPILASTS